MTPDTTTASHKIGPYTVIEHTETVKPERFVVFWERNGKTERAEHLGKRGGFRTWEAAVEAATKQHRFGDANA
jgi:hypothetical protein